MLRTRWMLLASAFAVTPAFAQQTNVGAVRRDTTIRIVRGEVMMSAAEMRKLKEIIAQLITRNAQREAQLLSDATQSRRSIEAQEELEVAALEVMSKQRQLAFACAFARPSAGLPGTIGIDVDTAESVRWTWGLGPGKGSLTMRFGNKPPTVKSVAENSPAEKAGVRPGDVWVSVNGRLLVGEVRFDELLNPGTNVVLRVSRGGRDIDLPAVPVAKQPVALHQPRCR
jgi:S1-C subfamily serine protease